MKLEDKIEIVKDMLKDKKVAVGFSGGADSTLIAYLSSKVAKDTLAITIDNHLFPKGFIEHTKRTAESFNIGHEIIDINFYEDEDFLKNSSGRCYTCRDLMYSKIKKLAELRGFDFVCDGNNISDLVVDRPGILITYKNEFKTPLIEARLTSKEIHEYLNINGIGYSRSTTCIATRIPTDTKISKDKINRIRDCEDYISSNTDCKIVKVRNHGKDALIEVDDVNEVSIHFNQISDKLKSSGFENVTLNPSEIDDDEYIEIDYTDGSFSYQLPFTINIPSSAEQLEDSILSKGSEMLELENIVIYENGLITGNGLESYDKALECFMDTLPKIRRNV